MFAFTCEDPPPLTNRKPVYITGSTGFPVQWCELLCRCIISEGLLLTHLLMEKFLFYHRTFPLAVTVHTEGEYLGVYFTMEGECADSLWVWRGNADEPFSRLQTAASISDFILISRSQDAAHSSLQPELSAHSDDFNKDTFQTLWTSTAVAFQSWQRWKQGRTDEL